MPWEYLEDEAIADIGIKVTANTLNELFNDSCLAICHLMTDLSDFDANITKVFTLEESDLVRLLYNLMEEILVLKDAEILFTKNVECSVTELDDGMYKVEAKFTVGDFNRNIHHIGNDVKSITYHDFYIKEIQEQGIWQAHFIIDI
jgi:SHS2 domain-containing protein